MKENYLKKIYLAYFRFRPEVRRLIFYDSKSELNSASFEQTLVKFGRHVYEISKIHVLRRRKIFRNFFYECVGHPAQPLCEISNL